MYVLHICCAVIYPSFNIPGIPLSGESLQASSTIKPDNPPVPVPAYRGDAIPPRANEPPARRCRPPPSTLFLLPEADKTGFADAPLAEEAAGYAVLSQIGRAHV